jgi:ATP synthase protein I
MKGLDLHPWQQIGTLATLGITLVAATAIGLAIGYQLDKWLRTSPWLTILFLLLGIAAGFVNLFRETWRAKEED